MPRKREIFNENITPGKDPTSPEKIISITGLDSPFPEIESNLKSTLEKNDFWDGLREPLEKSLPIIEIQSDFIRDLVEIQVISDEKALERFKAKKPMLDNSHLLVYSGHFNRLIAQFINQSGKTGNGKIFDDSSMMTRFLDNPENLVDELLEAQLSDEDSLLLALNAAHQVFAVHAAGKLRKLVEYDPWNLNFCPICGTSPEMGKITSVDGHYYLICSLCMTEWKYKRVGCPFCDNLDTNKLGHFQADEYPSYQVNYCDKCKSYIKVSREKDLGRHHLPIFDNLMSLELDSSAVTEGFKRGEISTLNE